MDINKSLIDAVRLGRLGKVKKLISSYGLSYSKAWSDGYVLLRESIENKHTEVTKLLLTSGCKIKSKRRTPFDTPLHLAVKNDDIEIVQMLIDRGANITARDQDGSTPLHLAVDNTDTEMLEMLINKGADINAKDKDGSTPLHLAVENTDTKMVDMLIDKGADINAKDQDGSTPLHNAINYKRVEVTELLLRMGADINSENNFCTSPLHLAVEEGCLQIIEHLLEYGAYVNSVCTRKNRKGCTPLHIATEKGSEEIIKFLLSRGANVNARGIDGKTSLHIGTEIGHFQIVELLLKHGAYVNYTCNSMGGKGYTPLHIAAERGDTEIVKLLLSSNAHINASTKAKLTPLYLATESGHKNVVKLLLDQGASVDIQDRDGKTILHLAAQKRYSDIIEHILKHCPDVNNKNNRNSLNVAVHGSGKDHSKIVESLLQYDFSVDPEHINNCKLLHTEDLSKYGTDVNMLYTSGSKTGYTPLHNATKNKKEKVTGVNVKDAYMKTPIFYAVENSDYEIFKLLLIKGADIKDNPELLNTAVKKGCKEIIEALLQHDANINASDKYGRTALHFTALHERVLFSVFRINEHADNNNKGEIAKLLLSMGANVDAQTIHGTTTLHTATKQEYIDVVEVLLEYNADANSADNNGTTPLHMSAEKGNKIISIMLLNKGANVNAKNKNGSTALHMATTEGHKEVVEVLLKHGAKVDYKDKESMTPFHIAVSKGYLEIAKILLQFGADIDSRDGYGRTALHIASKEGDDRIVSALLEYGSDINIFTEYNRTPLDFVMDGIQSFYYKGSYYDSDNEYDYNDFDYEYNYNNFDDEYDYNDFDDDYNYNDFDDEYNYNYGHGICSSEIVAKILKKQIIKMKTANLYVNKSNLSCINNNRELNKFQYECEKEIESMKVEIISNTNVSFHDILTKNISQLAIYTRNENIVQVLKSDDYKAKFPLYASIINNRFRKGVERRELLEQVNKFVHFLFNGFPQLPYNCTEKIFSYLNDKDLGILINVCEHVKVPNTDISDIEGI